MKRMTIKTYLTIPVFLGMLLVTGQVAADENLVTAPAPANPTVATEVDAGVPAVPAPENLPEQGSHTFTERSGVKAEPKVSSPNLDYYEVGETANYDKTVEEDNNLWISYTNYAGSRSYVSVGQLEETAAPNATVTPAPVEAVQPALEVNSAPAEEVLPASGTYTFAEKTGVKSEPKVSAKNHDFYTAGETVNYDKTLENDSHLWLSYVNYSGGRSYVAVKELKPTSPAPVSQPTPPAPAPSTTPTTTGSTSANLPAQGTYTFTEKTGVKSEPKVSAKNHDFYTPGEKVNYDKTLESDNHVWLSYINYSGGRSYVAVKELKPASPAPVSQPTPPAPAPSTTPTTTGSTSANLPAQGTYTFTEKTGVKSEPKVSAKNHDFYTPGEKVNYDKTLESDNHVWLSYINYSGGRSYVAVKELKPTSPAPVSQPTPPAPAPSTTPTTTGSTSANLPAQGTYTFTEKTGVKSEPKVSAKNHDFYTPGEKVNYDKTLESDNHVWLSYINYSGGRSYVAVKELKPASPAPVSQPTPPAPAPSTTPTTTGSTSANLPAQGTYTFTEKTGVKSEPKVSAKNHDFYTPGEKVNYDKTLESDNHVWLSYINYSGGRSYVAVKELKPASPAPVSQPTPPAPAPSTTPTTTGSTSANLPAQGTYTFTEKTGVKSEPKVSAKNHDFYTPGEKVNYDKTLESDNHVWLSYINYSGGRSYVAVKELKPASPAPVSQPTPPAPAPSTTPTTTGSTSANLPAQGTYTFTEKTGVKSEPKVSAKNHDFYTPGEKVNYDKTLESDNHVWLSYVNYSGGRSYVAVKELKPASPAPVSQPVSPVQPAASVEQPTVSNPIASTPQPTVPVPTEAPVTEVPTSGSTDSEASVGQTDSTTVTAQPTVPAPTEAPVTEAPTSGSTDSEVPTKEPVGSETTGSAAQPVLSEKPTVPVFPSNGTYTFTEKVGVKSEPKLISPDRDYYYPGEKVNYDKTLEADDHLWLSYINYSGGRSYVAIKPLERQLTEEELKAEAAKKHNAQVVVSDYQENKPSFTVELTGQEDTKRLTKFRVAVWSEDKGQDDLKWYEPTITDNKAKVVVSIGRHSNTIGGYRVQAYTTYSDEKTVEVDLGTFHINKKEEYTTSASQGNYDVLTRTIFLDAGHGGYDPGAVYSGKTEKALNLAIQEGLMSRLIKEGYQVVLTRAADSFADLIDRSKRANETLSDLFVSIHFNASSDASANGIETYYNRYEREYPPQINKTYHVNPERLNRSKFLAEAIQKETVANTGARDNGVRRESFSVVRETTAPAVLLELGYMSNPAELAKISQKSYQEKLIDGIFKGIQAYYKQFS